MTDEEIDAMEAGSELDRLIAERIFGPPPFFGHYSTNIAEAWRVVDKLLEETEDSYGYGFSMTQYWDETPKIWAVHFEGSDGGDGYGETVPLAICRAALKVWFASNYEPPCPLCGCGEGDAHRDDDNFTCPALTDPAIPVNGPFKITTNLPLPR